MVAVDVESWRWLAAVRMAGPGQPLPLPCPPTAEFQGALAEAWGDSALPRAFMAVRRSEWEHFGGMPAEAEAAALYARY